MVFSEFSNGLLIGYGSITKSGKYRYSMDVGVISKTCLSYTIFPNTYATRRLIKPKWTNFEVFAVPDFKFRMIEMVSVLLSLTRHVAVATLLMLAVVITM